MSETATLLAILFAEERLARVLLLTGSKPALVEVSGIQAKPDGLRTVIGEGDWESTRQVVEEHCRMANQRRSRFGDSLPPYRPVVVVNDVDYYVAESERGGAFTRRCDPAILDRVDTIGTLLSDAGGELVLTAVLDHGSEKHWSQIVTKREWKWRREDFLITAVSSAQPTEAPVIERLPMIALRPKRRRPVRNWSHAAEVNPPPEFQFGPLVGTLKDLSHWLCPGRKRDRRRVFMKVSNRVIWVRMVHKRCYEVFFNSPKLFAEANGRKLKDEQESNGNEPLTFA